MSPPNRSQHAIKTVGVIGLGHMGHAFATNLVADGYDVITFDHDPKRAAAVTGARAVEKIRDVADCDAVMTSVPDDDALAAVTLDPGGLVSALGKGAIHVSMSTVSPQLSQRLAEKHAKHGQGFVAAPVLGNPDFARERKLYVFASGEASALEKVRPLLESLGQHLFVVGDNAASASLMKLGANALTATTLECMGEVLALLRKGGIGPRLAFDVLTNSLFDSQVHKAYGDKIVESRYAPGMAVPLATKDMRLALAAAEHLAVPLPAVSLVHDRLVTMSARGWDNLDWSALGRLAAEEAGLGGGSSASSDERVSS
jgi:3-hydroxyisobutyrate dehydrogenase-like beta-hydroxyacid dehydrogenase